MVAMLMAKGAEIVGTDKRGQLLRLDPAKKWTDAKMAKLLKKEVPRRQKNKAGPEVSCEAEEGIYHAGCAEVEGPRFIKKVPPEYPRIAVPLRIQGYVILEAVLGADGLIYDIRVLKNMSDWEYGFEVSAAKALRRWKFFPGKFHGEPVDTRLNLKIDFVLDNMGRASPRDLREYEKKRKLQLRAKFEQHMAKQGR